MQIVTQKSNDSIKILSVSPKNNIQDFEWNSAEFIRESPIPANKFKCKRYGSNYNDGSKCNFKLIMNSQINKILSTTGMHGSFCQQN